MTSCRSSRQPARLHRGPSWLVPHHCTAQRGRLRRWRANHGSPCRAGRWRQTPSRPPSCDTRQQSPASQTPRTWDPERKGRDPLRWEPAEEDRRISDYGLTESYWSISVIDQCFLTASTRLSADPRFSVSWAPSCEGTLRVVYARYGGGATTQESHDTFR